MCGSRQQNSDEHPRAVSSTSTSPKISSRRILHKQPKCTPSDKEQLLKLVWQQVRNDLHRGIMILPSSHMLEAMGAARREPRRGESPMMLCQQQSEIFPFIGVVGDKYDKEHR